MRQLYIKQKVLSLSGKFSVKDELENEVYFVEGSFMQVPKTFSIMDVAKQEVAMITKKTFSFLPTFLVEVHGQETMTIEKGIFFFESALYNRCGWDRSTEELVGHGFRSVPKRRNDRRRQQKVVHDSYQLQIVDDEMEPLLVALVVAIDCAKATTASGG